MGFQSIHHQEEYNRQREENFRRQAEEKKQKNRRRNFLVSVVLVIILLIAGGSIAGHYILPGPYDPFAKCLTEKGAVMYGAIKWCKYTQAQAAMFGKSFQYVDYHDESDLPGINKRPTWVINDKWYQGVQSFQTLAAATGCSYN